MHQSVACAEAGVTLISPFVGRILDWYKKNTDTKTYAPADDPGVQSVTRIYNYYKRFGYETKIMGASFRNADEIRELAGCDLLTISPGLLEELHQSDSELPRKLEASRSRDLPIEKIEMNQEAFAGMHAEDQMTNDKLAEGIAGFSKAIEELEQMLEPRLEVENG
jgi:transaldolase